MCGLEGSTVEFLETLRTTTSSTSLRRTTSMQAASDRNSFCTNQVSWSGVHEIVLLNMQVSGGRCEARRCPY